MNTTAYILIIQNINPDKLIKFLIFYIPTYIQYDNKNKYKMKSFTRYQQPSLIHSTYDLKSKSIINTKPAFINTSHKNPQTDLLKLPALNSMRRSASMISGTERNTKFKLQNLEDKLEELASEVRNSRLQAQETMNNIHFLNESLANSQLNKIREDLKKQIKGLERVVLSTKVSDESRCQAIKQDCRQLWTSTQEMRQSMYELRIRTDNLEEAMGFQRNRL